MNSRKIIFSVIIALFTTQFAFGQSEVLKGVVNSLAFYNKQKDLKYLAAAKKKVDSVIVTRKDSANLEKNIYRAVVYSAIAYVDSTNKLSQPADFFTKTSALVDRLSKDSRVFKYQPEISFSRRCLANVCLRQGFTAMRKLDYSNALSYFKKAQTYTPSFRPLNGYIALANSRLGNIQEAAKYYNTLLDTDTLKSEYLQAAISTYKSLGDTAKALQIIKKGREAIPTDRTLLLEEANIHNNRQDYRSLAPLLPGLLDSYGQNADVAFIAANCYDHLNDFERAESLYLRTIDLNTALFEPVFNLGLLYLKISELKKDDNRVKNLRRAAQWLEKANEISPNETKCLDLLKLVYAKTGDQDQLNKVDYKLKQLTN